MQLTFNGDNATLSTTVSAISTAAAGDTARELYHGFLVGDIIRAQEVKWDGGTFAGVFQSNLEVTSVGGLYTYGAALVSGDVPAIGMDFVRLGNVSDTTRQGAVYLTADDSAAPFIDIVDGITKHADWNTAGKIKARLGKLTGISDADFGGALSGYGLYSTNVYLKGNIWATSGIFSGTVYASAGTVYRHRNGDQRQLYGKHHLDRRHYRRVDAGRNFANGWDRRQHGRPRQRRHQSGVLCGQRHAGQRAISGDEGGRIDGDQRHDHGRDHGEQRQLYRALSMPASMPHRHITRCA